MEKEVIEGNKMITEFMEVDIIAATSEELPRSSYSKKFKTFSACLSFCEGVNEHENERKYFPIHYRGEMKYHSSWDWQIPVWAKIFAAVKSLVKLKKHLDTRQFMMLTEGMRKACLENDPLYSFNELVDAITWYNSNKQG